MHDALEFEKLGLPAVAICTDAFRAGAETVAGLRGVPQYPFAVVPHPIGVLNEAELTERAREALPQILQSLMEHPLRPEREVMKDGRERR